ncbi:MAG: DUF2157 domain-containing protein [Ferruginibacter sp.]|nr:DUF2157 domain-containing protein [Cytophagales bacterium]
MPLLDELLRRGLISAEQHRYFTRAAAAKPFSLNGELQAVLYAGVLLLSAGLGGLIYQNLATIGHQAVIGLLVGVTFAGFYYAYRNQPAFSVTPVEPRTPLAAYALLLGCLSFLVLEGYLQAQYRFFGPRHGLAAFIPAVLFLGLAYYFDHRGVLSLALTALAAWAGVAITPLDALTKNDFAVPSLLYTALALGAGLVAVGRYQSRRGIKKHFTFTYLSFGGNLLLVATLAGLFTRDDQRPLYAALLAGLVFGFIAYARREHSFFFLLMAVLYGYAGVTYLVFRSGIADNFYVALFYLVLSCGGVIYFLLNSHKSASRES